VVLLDRLVAQLLGGEHRALRGSPMSWPFDGCASVSVNSANRNVWLDTRSEAVYS
jgi:hypothetical protein